MANDCLPQVQACAMRVALLDDSGVPLPGASSLYVSNALSTLGFAWEVEAGTQIREKNACDEVIVDWKAPDNITRGNVTVALLTPDPELSSLLSGVSVLTVGARVGAAAPALGPVDDQPVSIELWARRIRDGKLDPTWPYAWWVYPFVTNLRPDDHEHSNANLGASFVGEAYENDNWFNGPLNDWPTTSDRVWQWVPTNSIPTAQCGFQAISAT